MHYKWSDIGDEVPLPLDSITEMQRSKPKPTLNNKYARMAECKHVFVLM